MKMLSIVILIVFLSTSALNMSIFYEGLMLKWFDFVLLWNSSYNKHLQMYKINLVEK